MTVGGDGSDRTVGYRQPPVSTRFAKGQSGNPSGRPRGSRTHVPYEAVLGRMVTIREDGIERRVTAAEAFLLQMAKSGLEGDGSAARATMTAIDQARAARGHGADPLTVILLTHVTPGSVNAGLVPLRMAVRQDSYRPTARIAIEPWLVEAALARLGERRLTRQEQAVVVKAARTPKKVRWPDWWVVLPK